jgi:hypothetical protein
MGADGYKRIQGPVSDTELGTTYLKLEPIKEELTWTGGVTLVESDQESPTTESGIEYTWTFGSAVLAGISTGVILQFVEYDLITGCEKILWHGVPTISSTTSMEITYLGEEERKYGTGLSRTRVLGKNLLYYQSYPNKRHRKPILKMYVLPANYVTKQINISTIQSYWQDPTFSNVMWLQHIACCSFTSGPFHSTVTEVEDPDPATITQAALVSKATTGTEVFHNIIPLLDKIMTYAN